jgi:hypothetical protein
MPTATLTTCTLEVIARPKPSRYEGKPDYRPCLFKLADSSQKWKSYNEGSAELTWLKQGQTYQAAIAADGELTLIQPTGPAAPAPVATPAVSQAQEIGQYLDKMAALYAACYRRAATNLDGAPDAAIQAAASTVFISAQRKFGL